MPPSPKRGAVPNDPAGVGPLGPPSAGTAGNCTGLNGHRPDACLDEARSHLIEVGGSEDVLRRHPAFRNLKEEQMIKDGLSAPLHAGAVKYYKERGWM